MENPWRFLDLMQISKWGEERRYTLDKIIKENKGIEKNIIKGLKKLMHEVFITMQDTLCLRDKRQMLGRH